MRNHPFKMAWKNIRTFIFDTVAFYIDVWIHTLTYCTSSHIHIFIHTYSCHNRFITPHTKPLNINSFRIVFENVAKIKTLLPIFIFGERDSESKSESENENERLEPNLKMSMKILFKHML